MIKFSDRLFELNEEMRRFAKKAYDLLMDILYPDIPEKRRRRKIDKKLRKLLGYLGKIDSLGFRFKLDVVTKKEVVKKSAPNSGKKRR